MKLRPRLTIFTLSLIVAVVAVTSVSTVLAVRSFMRREMKANQLTWFDNFHRATEDALYLGQDLAVRAYSESLEKSVPELAYAVYVDAINPGSRLGGLDSLQRFDKLAPACAGKDDKSPSELSQNDGSERWLLYCQPLSLTNLKGEKLRGTVYVGFSMNVLEIKLNAIIHRMMPGLAWSMAGVLVLGFLGALVLSERMTRPIRELTKGAKAIGDGTLSTHIPVETADELGFLAEEFNLMAYKLREVEKLKDEFVSSVSHELRSPLSAISGYVELLRGRPFNEIDPIRGDKALGVIQESAYRLTEFVNDILDLAKLKANRFELRRSDTQIGEVAEDVMTLLHPLFEKKEISGVIDLSAVLPVISVDEEKIRQVLTNLVANALKFTPSKGKIIICAKNQADSIEVSVQDTGIGIPEEARNLVFEKFGQAGNHDAAGVVPKVTGLGLAIAKGNVEAHGGRIWLESELGKGTTFFFTLPKNSAATESPVA